MVWDVVVVGAGIAGLTCAQRLQGAGYQVLVLEKSRGLGGRLATRRVGDQPIDHGCRFLAANTPQMARLLARLQAEGWVRPWQPAVYTLHGAELRERNPDQSGYVAPQGMTAVPKRLAADLTVWRQTRVLGLTPGEHWRVQLGADTAQAELLQARAVVLAIPAPQALEILQPLEKILDAEVFAPLRQVRFHASIAVMAGFAALPATPFTAQPEGWIVYGQADPIFQWAGLDSAKRVAPQQAVVVVQSCDRFAQPYLDTADLTKAGQILLAQTANKIGADIAQPQWLQVHRWRYATVHRPAPQRTLATALPLPLACCGDWCGGSDGGAALQSGWETAETVHRWLKGDSEGKTLLAPPRDEGIERN